MKIPHQMLSRLAYVAIFPGLITSLIALSCHGQGTFIASNFSAPTRIGFVDGPFAGPGIWGQFLAGPAADSLVPIGSPLEHVGQGRVAAPGVVPGIPTGETAYVQMVAWDGTIWGNALEGVPATQLGRTEILPVILGCPPFPTLSPGFTQPAVVPPVPEPGIMALCVLGLGTLGAGVAWRRRR